MQHLVGGRAPRAGSHPGRELGLGDLPAHADAPHADVLDVLRGELAHERGVHAGLHEHLPHRPQPDRGEPHERRIGVLAARQRDELPVGGVVVGVALLEVHGAEQLQRVEQRGDVAAPQPLLDVAREVVDDAAHPGVDGLAHAAVEPLDRDRVAARGVEQVEQHRVRLTEAHPEQRGGAEHVRPAEVLADAADGLERALPHLDRPRQQRRGVLDLHQPSAHDPDEPGLACPAEEQHDLGELVARAGAVAGEVVEVERFGDGAGVVELQPARRGSANGPRAPSG